MNDVDERRTWRSYLPILTWARQYQRSLLRGDMIAGAVVAALAVPQSLGYAAIAGVPVQVGLYAVPTALLAYAVFGTSKQLIVGPVSTVSVLSGSLVASLDPVDESEAIAYTVALALGSGLVLVILGLLRVGWIAEFLSKPIVTGFVFGLTILVIVGEIPKMVGVPVPDEDVMGRIFSLISGFLVDWDLPTVAISAVSLLVLFGLGARLPRVPWALVLVVVGIIASNLLDLEDAGIAVVGEVPSGLPAPGLPGVEVSNLLWLAAAGAALALVGLAEGLSAARLFAGKGGYRIDADQDLIASGAANISSGLFGGLGVAGSLSKTAAAAQANGRSQVTGITTAVLAILVIVAFAPTLSALPLAILSAIVVNAVWGLMDVSALRRYRQVRRLDLVAAVAAAVGVLAFGPLPGLAFAVLLSVLGLVYRASRVSVEVLGRIQGEKAAWGSLADHGERHVVPGIVVLRIDSPLFWVNAMQCQDEVLALAEESEDAIVVLIDLEGTNVLDTTGADMLDDVVRQLHDQDIDVYLVRVRYPVRLVLRRSGVMDQLGEDHVWHSISQGVKRARADHGITAPLAAFDSTEAGPRGGPEDEDEFGHRWSPLVP
jgi:high affinity sulfate transporter 1